LDSEHVQLLSTFQRRGQLNGVSLSWRLGTENSRYERIQSSVWSWAFAIVEADLFEISICAGDYRPAIPGTWLQVKDATVSGRQPRSSGGRRELRRIGGVLVEIEYHDFADRSIPATIRTVPNSGIPGIFVRECGG
ncbi:MAG TPA: hypothetical protein VES67_26630, partial [Vicinamibacterales bacterium]|nr:hypothetical protein [Vicinamibacterales bacterium]